MLPLCVFAAASTVGFNVGEDGQPNRPLSQLFRAGIERQRLRALETEGESITIMTVGDAGLGKTSLLSSLFRSELTWPEVSKGSGGARIAEQTVGFDLDGLPFNAHLVDTKGLGDFDPRSSFGLVTRRVEFGLRRTLQQELRINRAAKASSVPGARKEPWSTTAQGQIVDVVIYFFAPHRCRRSDLALLRQLRGKVSILPVLAKADSMTADELERFRAEVSQSSSQSSP